MAKDTTSIKDNIYTSVEAALKNTKTRNAYKNLVSDFISKRTEDLYDILPCSRLLCGEEEMDLLFPTLNIDKNSITEALSKTYYAEITNFNPRAAKHEFTVTQLMVVRYFLLNNMKNELEVALIHMAFSGKFYPSIHYRSFPTIVPVRYVMEYVVNNNLSKKYDLVSAGNVVGAIKSICNTWIASYKDRFKKCKDEDCVYLIQQLHSRIGSFMKNIADEYYKAYQNKDSFFAYSSDSYDEDNYHISDNDSLKLQRIVERTINHINSTGVDYKICSMCSDENITVNEIRSIIESILNNPDNVIVIKELISLMVATYFQQSDNKDVTDRRFLTYSIASKPNAKQKEIVRQKEIINELLSENSTAYLRRRSRIATRNSYERAIRMYFALVIHNANR